MQLAFLILVSGLSTFLFGQDSGEQDSAGVAGNQQLAANVNSRYVVERAEIQPEGMEHRLGQPLLALVRALPGQTFNSAAVEELAQKIRTQLPAYQVVLKVSRGAERERLRVTFELIRKGGKADVVVPRFSYHSKQNFTFGADANIRHENFTLSAGVLTDQDELLERYSGIRFGAQREGLAAGRLRAGVAVELWRTQWNPTVESASQAPESTVDDEIYRTRTQFRPYVAVRLFEPLEWEAGVSTHRLQMQSPVARHELSSAAYTSLRLVRRWKSPEHEQKFTADYDFRLGASTFGSDFAFRRHLATAVYRLEDDHDVLIASAMAGWINGRAPLFERFVLGNSRTLRGWSKWDVAPLGSDQMVHASIDYSYREFRVVYDAGSSRAFGGDRKLRQSIAVGYGRGFGFLIAFPLREGRMEPIFMLGMNF
ncbi:MAG TPA: hypothetical protein VFB63_19305 [Bryobacteraceae bacterium]|nr:hypothetical protein [Bryobacteraceae bacterium]